MFKAWGKKEEDEAKNRSSAIGRSRRSNGRGGARSSLTCCGKGNRSSVRSSSKSKKSNGRSSIESAKVETAARPPKGSKTEDVLDILAVTSVEITSEEKAIETTPGLLSRRNLVGGMRADTSTESIGRSRGCIAELISRTSSDLAKEFDVQSDLSEDFDNEYLNECNQALETLKESWGVKLEEFPTHMQQPLTRLALASKTDGVIVMEGWNKALAFRSMFSEAIIGRWRMLAAMSELQVDELSDKPPKNMIFSSIHSFYHDSSESSATSRQALYSVEKNTDPLARCLGLRIRNLESLVVGMIDMSVRELCPHTQVVLREAYTAAKGSADEDVEISEPFIHEDECKSLDEYCLMFARYGMKPQYWVDFCEAFVWTMKSHNPYANQEQDIDDFEKPNNKSAFGTFVSGMIAVPVIEASLHYDNYLRQNIFSQLQTVYSHFHEDFTKQSLSHDFSKIFKQRPDLADQFSQNGVQEIYIELLSMLQNLIKNLEEIREHDSDLRQLLARQGEVWLHKMVPFDFVALLGNEYLDAVKPFFHDQVGPSLAIKLEKSLAYLYREAMHFIMQPLVIDRNLRNKASAFYEDLATELSWSNQVLQKRMVEVNLEIHATGTYTQTTQEIETGARLAWRNSGKCIGRIAWNTLKIRDRRHLFSAATIFQEVDEHIQIASGGNNIESVMTVFRPQQPHETFGLRFWSGQLFRYAGYKNSDNGEVLGDPANADFTEFLIKSNLWTPPPNRTAFDLLPLVLKLPTIDKPFVYVLPQHLRHEVNIEHPDFPAVKNLGLRWSTIPAITNFKLNLGGIRYPCIPFNGWFVSTEIARNLLERYRVTLPLAKAMNIPSDDRMLAQKVSAEIENAILHSFEKSEYTIVDPMTVGKSYLTHCKRERRAGRECPGQWSWVGGLVGPTNPTWHLEMRDFLKEPQYEWGANPWQVISFGDSYSDDLIDTTQHKLTASLIKGKSKNYQKTKLPRVLIAYGSETGTAEAAANSLARKLKVCVPKVMSLNDVAKEVGKISPEYTHLLAVCSTFGNGEPPSNAKDFFEMTLDPMDRVACAVLALGSSLYPKFCQAGKDLYNKIVDAGGDTLMKLTCIDGVEDSQSQIIQWTERINKLVLPDSLMDDLLNMAPLSKESTRPEVTKYDMKWRQESDSAPLELKQFQYPERLSSRCTKNTELLTESQCSTKYIEFELADGVTCETGDHLAVYPINDLSLVQRFLHCFAHELEKAAALNGYYRPSTPKQEAKNEHSLLSSSIIWQAQQPFYLESNEFGENVLVDIPHLTNVTLLEAFQAQLDLALTQETYVIDLISMMIDRLHKSSISTPLSRTFKLLSQSVLGGATSRKRNLSDMYPTIVHLLEEFGSIFCEPYANERQPILCLADLIVLMPRMNPRYYSILSSASSFPSTATITVEVVTSITKDGEEVKGVCSSYLAGLEPGSRAKVSIKKSLFRPPERKGAPIVMIAADTGIASLIGFLRERSKEFYTGSNKNIGKCHLFLGCKTRKDILYHDELFSWQSINIMDLYLAVSDDDRLPQEHVQDKLKEHGKKLDELLQSEYVHVYICGKTKMATNSTKMCIEAMTTYGGMSRIAAVRRINQMRVEKRWMFDIYDNGNFTEVLQNTSQKQIMSKDAGSIWSSPRFLRTEKQT